MERETGQPHRIMNESTAPTPKPGPDEDGERTKQVTVVGWVAGLSAFFSVATLTQSPTWPVAFGIAAIAAMVAVVCHAILKRS